MTNEQQTNILLPTNEDTTGPYFPTYFSDESYEDLTQIHSGVIAGPTGQHITLQGRVLDRNGKLANGVLLEFWQANAKGIYRNPSSENHPDLDPWFDGYGRLRSTTGEYTYRTIFPGASKDRAPNITITIFSDGINRIVTQIFFANQKANEGYAFYDNSNSISKFGSVVIWNETKVDMERMIRKLESITGETFTE